MLSSYFYLIPELYFCFIILSLISYEYVFTNNKLHYKVFIEILIYSVLVLGFLYIIEYQYIVTYKEAIMSNNNYYVNDTMILFKIILTTTLLVFLGVRKVKWVYVREYENGATDIINSNKRYLIIFCISFLSLLLLQLAFNFITFIICIELLGISNIVLISEPEYGTKIKSSNLLSKSLSYYIIHVFGSLSLLMGCLFIYLATGTLNFYKLSILSSEVCQFQASNFFLDKGLLIFFLGLFIKAGIAPYYLWVLKAYQNLNIFNLSYFLIIVKTSILYVIYQFIILFPEFMTKYNTFFLFIAVLNLIFGPYITIKQFSLKKFIIGSSITNVGYLFLSITFFDQAYNSSLLLLFILVYFLSMISFLILESYIFLTLLTNKNELLNNYNINLMHLKKLPQELRILLVVSLISLMGFPPALNFFIKLKILNYLFIYDTIIGFLAFLFSMLAMAYYLLVIVELLFIKKNTTTLDYFFDVREGLFLYKFILIFGVFFLFLLSIFFIFKYIYLFYYVL